MAPEFGKPINQLPLIPADVLKKHSVHEPLDTRFRSAARLLQALWRKDRELAIGRYVSKDGKRRTRAQLRTSRGAGFQSDRKGFGGRLIRSGPQPSRLSLSLRNKGDAWTGLTIVPAESLVLAAKQEIPQHVQNGT